jgi:DNA-binding MarR family transcriptional regulator
MAPDPYKWNEQQLNRFYMTSVGRLLFDLTSIDEYAGLEMLKASGYPVTAAHINVVPHIEIDGIRLTDLAQRAHLTKQSAWEALKNMEAHGYIARTKDPTDARAILISWTAKGIAFLRVVCLGLLIREDDLARRLGMKEAKLLKELLTKLRESYAKEPTAMAQFISRLNSQRKRAPRTPVRRRSR